MADSVTSGVPFIHLRTHSAYSLSEGALPVKKLVELAIQHQMPALGVTDSGNLFGALEISETLAASGIQPIIGCTIKVDFAGKGNGLEQAPGDYPVLALLARNEAGYGCLMKLSSKAYLQSDSHDLAHVSIEDIARHSEGLICLTGGPGGPVNQALFRHHADEATRLLSQLHDIFGDCLYVELQRHAMEAETAVEAQLMEMAFDMDLPLVASNEPYFAAASDYPAHDALLCISQGVTINDDNRFQLTPEHYFKSPREMASLFADIPEAIENTVEIAMRCSYRPQPRKPILPNFLGSDDGGKSEADILRENAVAGLKKRLEQHGLAEGFEEKDYWDRLEYELGILIDMDFPGYFLIVADFIQWAKAQGIPVGPGRGSGAGSVTAWALTITDLDPLRFKLIFERFLNPERISMPDFDIDFCQDRREEVIRYVQEKYGHDQVAQIITFGKLQARAVIRDVGRVLQMPYGQVDRLSKMIPNNPAAPISLKEAIASEARLREEGESDETVATLLDYGQQLEGLYRHASTHAAGLVIGDRPLDELVPLYRDPRSDMPVTQFNMKWVEKAGLVKFDFLGLKTLTVIQKAVEHLKARNIEIDPVTIPLDDGPTFDMLQKRETIGVFQYESSGMQDLMRKAKPENIEDLIAIVALFRPGPMENIPKYLAAKHGEEEPEFLHESITPVLEDTYGVIIYQEQVLKIAQVLAGYTLGQADILRKAMGKKIKEEMDAQRAIFVKGAVKNGVEEARANFIFDLVAKFAGYGFNKAHSACYAFVAYQTAYLKANYPVEFLAASMTLDMGNTDKLNVFTREAQRLGIKVRPPDINSSGVEFVVEDGAIIYSLSALKNVGKAAVEHLVAVRNEGGRFRSFGDFASRIDGRTINKRALESMARAGAFDGLNDNRAQVLASIEAILAMASRTSADAERGQTDFFGGAMGEVEDIPMPPVDPFLPIERLNEEFAAVGFYLSGHPLDDYLPVYGKLGLDTYASFREKALKQGARAAKLAGTLTYFQERKSKNGNKFAFVGFSDPSGQFETICFSEPLNEYRSMLQKGGALIVRVEADVEDEDVRLRLQAVDVLDRAARNTAQGLTIFIRDESPLDGIARRLENGGKSPVKLVVLADDGREISILLGTRYTVTPQIKG
ncbi:MAG TPA: DNA polymerase III subunit alpha, partial [Rhizobiales bacterium]|nr:DNA polymerase III subunit alpha [Hyphomicrobiales bacterium]